MKNILTILLILVSIVTAFGQAKDVEFRKHKIGLMYGSSTAFGDFEDTDPNNDKSGFAENGRLIALTYEYQFNINFSATFFYGGVANSFNAAAYAQLIANQVQDPFVTITVAAEPYVVGTTMFGVRGIIGDKVKAYLNPMIGFGSMITPEIDIIANNRAIGARVDQRIREGEPDGAFVVGLSLGADIMVSDGFSINVDYTTLSATFEPTLELETFDANGNPTVITTTGDLPFSTGSISLGIGVHF